MIHKNSLLIVPRSYSNKPRKIKRCCFIIGVIDFVLIESVLRCFFWECCFPSSWFHWSCQTIIVRSWCRWANWVIAVIQAKSVSIISWNFRLEFIGLLSPAFSWFDHMLINVSATLNWFRCWSCCCCCRRRCCCCKCLYDFTFCMTIFPSHIWISCIAPRFFVSIWTCAIVMLSNDWLVIGSVRPVNIPSLAGFAVLGPITTWNLWFWNVQAVGMTFFFSSSRFWREAIRWEVIIQFAKIMFSINRALIIEWTLSRVANVP